MNDKQIISLQIPTELYELIKKDSEEEFITMSAFIRKLLVQYYKEKNKWKTKDTSIK